MIGVTDAEDTTSLIKIKYKREIQFFNVLCIFKKYIVAGNQ